MLEDKYLITPTLLNSFNYFMNSESETALEDFSKVIKKEFTTNKYVEAGNIWENRVCHPSFKEDNKLVIEVADKIKYGYFQQPLKKWIVVNNIKILLYGKADVVMYDKIFDIKTTSSDYQTNYYYNSLQHKIYMYCTGIKNFEYLITKIKIKEQDNKAVDVEPVENFGEFYDWQDKYESDIFNCINDFFNFLKSNEELKKSFNELWKAKY